MSERETNCVCPQCSQQGSVKGQFNLATRASCSRVFAVCGTCGERERLPGTISCVGVCVSAAVTCSVMKGCDRSVQSSAERQQSTLGIGEKNRFGSFPHI